MNHRNHLVLLPANRVWRSYTGGRTLEALAGAKEPSDSQMAEDWIGSVTEARFAGREGIREGVSQVLIGGISYDFKDLLDADPEYFLGAAHVRCFGANPMLLVKYLDSAIRLSFQVHPSADFARKFLRSNSGKTEAYYFLGARAEGEPPYFYLGFQRPPSPAELRSMVERQDIAAIERCFNKIVLQPGDAYLIPGGVPHALGPGAFLIEIQEPTDLTARLEFERAGYVLPEGARFLGRDADFGISMIDFTPKSMEAIDRDYRCRPRRRLPLGPQSWQEDLIGPDRTPCFRVRRTQLEEEVTRAAEGFHIVIIAEGSLTVEAGGTTHTLNTYDRFCIPAGLSNVRLLPRPRAMIIECFPPDPTTNSPPRPPDHS